MRRFGSCREQQRHLQQGALSRFSVFRQTKMSLKASTKQNRIIKTFQQTSVLQGLGFLALWHVCMHLSVSVHTHSHVQHREVRRSLSLYTGCPGHPLHRYWFCHLSLVILDSFLRTRQTPWTSLKCVEDPWGDCHHVLALFSPLLFLGKQRAGPGSEDPVQHDLTTLPFAQPSVNFLTLSRVQNCSPKPCTKQMPTACYADCFDAGGNC